MSSKLTSMSLTLGLGLLLLTTTLVPAAAHVAPWQTRGTYWAPAPGDGHGFAMRLETTAPSGANALAAEHGSISFSPAAGTAVESLDALSFDLYLEEGLCGAGSPRMVLRLDTSGDGSTDERALAYPDVALDGDCPAGTWLELDLLDDAATTWVVPGQGHVDPSDAREHYAHLANGNSVVRVDLQWDNTVSHGTATVFFDEVSIGDHTLSEPTDGEIICPGTVEPGFAACPFRIA